MSEEISAQAGADAKKEHVVTINVDGKNWDVRKGKWIVANLKAAVGVDPSKVLAKITPHGIKDLADNEEISVKEDERFMSHARGGASS